MNCSSCRYWDNDGISPYGLCRARPPVAQLGWPRTSPADWCAEHATEKNTDDDQKHHARNNHRRPQRG